MSEPAPDPAPARGYSFPYGIPLVFYPLVLYAAHCNAGRWWAWIFHGVFLMAVSAFAWEALSRRDFEKIRATDPTLNRLTWVINNLVFFSLLPAAVWVFIFVF